MNINGGRVLPARRPDKKGAPSQYKTYSVKSPHEWRRAPCVEIQCDGYVNGWVMHEEAMTPEQVQAVTHSGRSFKRNHVAQGQTFLVFEAGQTCFKSIDDEHLVAVPSGVEIYLAGKGDHRSFNPREARRHTKPEHWIEDMQEQIAINTTLMERG